MPDYQEKNGTWTKIASWDAFRLLAPADVISAATLVRESAAHDELSAAQHPQTSGLFPPQTPEKRVEEENAPNKEWTANEDPAQEHLKESESQSRKCKEDTLPENSPSGRNVVAAQEIPSPVAEETVTAQADIQPHSQTPPKAVDAPVPPAYRTAEPGRDSENLGAGFIRRYLPLIFGGFTVALFLVLVVAAISNGDKAPDERIPPKPIPQPVATIPDIVMYAKHGEAIRVSPSNDAQKLRLLNRGESITGRWQAEKPNRRWLKITQGQPAGGYVSSQNLSDRPRPVLIKWIARSLQASRDEITFSEPDENSPVLDQMDKGKTVFVRGYTSDGWAEIESPDGIVGYVKKDAFLTLPPAPPGSNTKPLYETGCNLPVRPEPVDGAKATRSEMLAARKKVVEFIRLSISYDVCIQAKEESNPQLKETYKSLREFNRMQKEQVGSAFNEAAGIYAKRTNPGEDQ